jgi:cyclopropane-fatty-acyl-phospholipid synthase
VLDGGVFCLSELRGGFAGVKSILAADVLPVRFDVIVHPRNALNALGAVNEVDVVAASFVRADVLVIRQLQMRGVDGRRIDVPVAFDFRELTGSGVYEARSGGCVLDDEARSGAIHTSVQRLTVGAGCTWEPGALRVYAVRRVASIEERFASEDPNARIAAAALRCIFGDAYARQFAIRLWEDTFIPAQEQQRFTLCVNEPGALRMAFKPPIDLNAGRAFAAGLLDVEGDMEAAIDAMMAAMESPALGNVAKLTMLLRRLPVAPLPKLREAELRGKRHSLARDRAAIGFHYDQPVAFYRSFLDSNLVYSCAYFDEGVDTLDQAQIAKIDYSLRKLRLKRGERLLDIGCGWGALVVRAAQEFGAYVLGVTLSERQYEEARRRISAAGVGDRARVERWDYRQLPATTFDKVVSIGMFEHVGREKLPEYFSTAHKLLKEGGLFLNHGIANQHRTLRDGRASGFMDRFIFPDGELVNVSDALQFAERVGFEVRDVENLREHYTRTLRAWMANLQRNRDAAIAAAGEQTYRAWRLYMAGSAQGFRTGRMGLFQSLLAKPLRTGAVPDLPPTRRDLYASWVTSLR